MTNVMASMGRKGDQLMAHVTPGDVVIPRDIVLENPEFLTKLKKAMQDMGGDYRTHIAGSGYEEYNPATGAPEFGFFSKAFKAVKKAVTKPLASRISPIVPVQQIAQTAGPVLGGPLGAVAGGMIGGPAGAAIGGMLGSQLGGALGGAQGGGGYSTPAQSAPTEAAPLPQTDTDEELRSLAQRFQAKRPDEYGRPADLFSRQVGGQEFGTLDPQQQRSYLATQGAFGGGLGGEEKDYYMNLLQRDLINEQGQMGDINQQLLPIERTYLQRAGLPTDDTLGFFQALQG